MAVRRQYAAAERADLESRAVAVPFEPHAVACERTGPRVDRDPLARQPGHEVVDAEHHPALAGRRPILLKGFRERRLARARRR
jgi:hypothetical protein